LRLVGIKPESTIYYTSAQIFLQTIHSSANEKYMYHAKSIALLLQPRLFLNFYTYNIYAQITPPYSVGGTTESNTLQHTQHQLLVDSVHQMLAH
jgi:hypothetical protein